VLNFTKGDRTQFAVQLPGSPDLTGCTVFFTAKRREDIETVDPDDELAVVRGQESAHDHPAAAPETGRTVITVLPEDVTGPVGEYLCDDQVVDAGGHPTTYKKWNGDLLKCRISPEATQRTA
jgi:hypothetical protein